MISSNEEENNLERKHRQEKTKSDSLLKKSWMKKRRFFQLKQWWGYEKREAGEKHRGRWFKQKRSPSGENVSKKEDEGLLAKQLCIISQEPQYQWEIQPDMVNYGSSHFNVLNQEKDLKESILIEDRLPSNFHKVKRIMSL